MKASRLFVDVKPRVVLLGRVIGSFTAHQISDLLSVCRAQKKMFYSNSVVVVLSETTRDELTRRRETKRGVFYFFVCLHFKTREKLKREM